jgi:hypothetical protein
MKRLRFGWVLLVVIVLASTGCKEDDPFDGDDEPELPETSITFTCQDTAGGIAGVLVGISSQASDRDAGVFLRSGDTDGFGKVKFSNLDPQTFYYSCSRTVVGGVITRKGEVTVDQDEEEKVTVNF